MKRVCYGLALVTMLCGTSSCEEKQKGPEVFQVDVHGSSDSDLLAKTLQKMTLRFTPLETNDDILLSFTSNVTKKKDSYFVEDEEMDAILQFDLQGRFLNKINRRGQGAGEYNQLSKTNYLDEGIYTYDWAASEIKVYDYTGSFIKTIVTPKIRGAQFAIDSNGNVVQSRSYVCDHRLMVYDQNGNMVSEHFKTPSKFYDVNFIHYPQASMGYYDGGIYFTQKFDNNIYLKKDSIETLATIDFGSMNLPTDFFDGDGDQLHKNYQALRAKSAAVMKIDWVTVTDEWIVFSPAIFKPHVVVYCHRPSGKVVLNKDFPEEYHPFLGQYFTPDGYDEKTGEFYLLVNAFEVKNYIENLRESDPDHANTHPHLKDIDTESIQEEDNYWVLSYKI